MRLHQFSKKQPCYYCGTPPPSMKEHAPPEMMFDGFDCDSITVPACEAHNMSKSGRDRAIVTAISMLAYQVWKQDANDRNLTPNVIKAVKKLEPNFSLAKNEVGLRDFLVNPPSGLINSLPYTDSSVNPENWIRQLTAALVWSAIGKYDSRIEWNNAKAWSPRFIKKDVNPINIEQAVLLLSEEETELDCLDWKKGWSKPKGYPPDIYSFDVCFEKWKEMELLFRHRFYNKMSVWFVGISLPSETKNALFDFVGNTKIAG